MPVLVDTIIWSLALRRVQTDLSVREADQAATLSELIREDRAKLIGPIRQEVLSGVREQAQFDRLRKALRSFPDEPLAVDDFESAAQCANRCRSQGIAGSPVDFLVCAVALERDWQIFTADLDFAVYANVLALRLLTAR